MLILFLVTLFVPLLLGVPVAFSLVISAIVLMASQDLFSSQLIVQQFVGGINSFSLLAVPFFMLAGELMNKGGITAGLWTWFLSGLDAFAAAWAMWLLFPV